MTGARGDVRAPAGVARSRKTARRRSGRAIRSAALPRNRTSPFSMKYAVSASSERDLHRLLDDDDGRVGLGETPDRLEEVGDDDGREPERQLVDQQEPGPHRERHGEREHLLLPTRQVSGAVARAVAQEREELERLLDDLRLPARLLAAGPRGEPEVLADRERREHTPAAGRHRDAESGDALGPRRG